jgi:plasmid maintenance system antidote protein VapI
MMVGMSETPTTGADVDAEIERVRLQERITGNVRAELARQHVAVGTVAEILGVHRNTAGERLSGKTPFYAHEVAALAARLGVTTDSLLAGAASWSQPPRGDGPGYLGPVVGGDR